MITKTKRKYDVKTVTGCITDNASDEAGAVAYRTFMNGGIEVSNDYFIPHHAICAVVAKTSNEQIEVDDKTCQSDDEPTPPTPIDPPTITGADDVSINEGEDFDPMDGVSAVDGEGNPIDVTVTGEVDTDKVGTYTLTYTATDKDGRTTTVTRTVIVVELATPVINGANDVSIAQGIGIDLKDGVTASVDGEEIAYTVSPETIEKCEVGEHKVTYTATANKKTTTVERTVTITEVADPTISGLDELTVDIGEEFDPLDGVTATDGNGNELTPTVTYQGVGYIEAHGTEYIDTGLKLNNNSRIVADMQYTYPASSKDGYRFTGDETTSSAMFRFGSHSNKYWFPKYGSESKQITPPTGGALLDRVTIDMDKNVFKINGEVVHTFAQATSDWETGGNCYIFAINAASVIDLSVARLYSYQIYDNDKLVLDLVPALQGEEACMYDKISGNYYTNKGTGAFTYGTKEIIE